MVDKVAVGSKYVIRKSVRQDAWFILQSIRKEDIEEWAASVTGGIANLENSVVTSTECWTVADLQGLPVMIFGVVDGDVPTTWAVATHEAELNAIWMWKEAAVWIADFFKRWPNTQCLSDDRNTVHHRWLEWLGYELQDVVSFGPFCFPFRYYLKESP